jgi:phage-related protein
MAIKIPIISEYDKRGQNDAETGLNKLGKSAKRLAKIGAVAFAAVGGAALVMGKKLLDAGERAATSNARIEQITKSMGQFEGATDQVTDRLVKLAEKTAKLVGVDQNLIKEGQALLLTFKSVSADADKVGGVFDRATKAAIDLAAAGFGSVTTNAVQLGKALEDPIKGLAALGKSGVTFTAEQKELIKTLVETGRVAEAQEIILKAVETQVGGTAEATSNASDRMKVAFSLLQEELGEKLLPVFEKFATFFVETLIPRMEEIYTKAAPYVLEAFRRLSNFVKNTAIPAFTAFVEYVKLEILPKLQDTFDIIQRIAKQITEKLGPAVENTLVGAFETLKEKMPGTITLLNNVLRILEGIVAAATAAVDALDQLTAGKASKGIGRKLGELINPLGNIPGLAEGGIVTRPTLAMIGEGGQSEAVIPLDKLGKMGGGDIIINVTGGLATSAEIGESVVNALRAYSRSAGPLQLQVA